MTHTPPLVLTLNTLMHDNASHDTHADGIAAAA